MDVRVGAGVRVRFITRLLQIRHQGAQPHGGHAKRRAGAIPPRAFPPLVDAVDPPKRLEQVSESPVLPPCLLGRQLGQNQQAPRAVSVRRHGVELDVKS